MSDFQVKVQPIFIKPHPNADRLDIGNVGSPDGWQVVIAKGRFKSGDLCAYVPENAVVPEWVLKHYGYWNEEKGIGMLAGSKGDRVKAVKLRDAFSLGIVLPINKSENAKVQDGGWLELEGCQLMTFEGDDVARELGIYKYEPPIPVCMAGEVFNAGQAITLNYDIENIKNWPDVFVEGEEVVMTEKLHGTNCGVFYVPVESHYANPEMLKVSVRVGVDDQLEISGLFCVASKGLGAQGLCFKWNDANGTNLYQRTTRKYFEQMLKHIYDCGRLYTVHMFYGEVFGNGVQDLVYGMKQGQVDFRLFDIYYGVRGNGQFMCYDNLIKHSAEMGIATVPHLYRGPYNREVLNALIQNQKSTIDPNQIIEGGVVKTVVERRHPELGRVNLKLINEKYLLRKGGTELN